MNISPSNSKPTACHAPPQAATAVSGTQVIGIVGGIASGKSTVGRLLEELGAQLLNADQAGHQVLREPEVIQQLEDRWGIDVIDEQGQLDRSSIAARVFADLPNAQDELHFLEQVTHPRIGRILQKQITAAKENKEAAVVLDAPLLFEAGWETLCDRVIFVDASPSTRKARAQQRGWSEAEWQKRETSQFSLGLKKERSDHVISTDGELDETRKQLALFWKEYVSPAAH